MALESICEKMPMILAWYELVDWDEWLKLCPGQMCSTWDEWHHGAEETLAKAAKDRVVIHASTIRPQPYLEWIKQSGKPINGYSRSEFAAEQIKDRFIGNHTLPEKLPKQAELNRMLRKAIEKNPELALLDVFDPYLRRPSASICPIFREDEQGKPEQYGSGVFIRIADAHFILSAAHVFDDFKERVILIPGLKSLVEIHGSYSTTPLPDSGSRKDDHFDMGYFRLDMEQRSDLDSSLLFLDERDCDPMDVTSDGDAYTLIGYQSELSGTIATKAQTQISRVSCSGVQDHRFEKLGLDPRRHILLQYRMKKGMSYKTMIQGKKHDFGGMSGGGVFAWSKDFPDPKAIAQPYLVGIITGYSSYHNVFIATRLHHVLSAIHKELPHLPIGYRNRGN
jgi:hypothetical protein